MKGAARRRNASASCLANWAGDSRMGKPIPMLSRNTLGDGAQRG